MLKEWLSCEQKRRLLADYAERVQALSVQAEMLYNAFDSDREEDLSERWHRVEQARIYCDIARLALGTHLNGHGC
jgi:hypothetical protein